MAKTKKNEASDVPAILAKAIRRAEKLEKTLLKLVAQEEPLSEAERLLKNLQKGLLGLRGNGTKDAPASPATKAEKVPGKTAGQTRRTSSKKAPGADGVVIRRSRQARPKVSADAAAPDLK
ncbi:hypothetical protein [Microvirga pudoricolor]|uniref:hypothetical protein n=1 Tax=Microvirga pudoricolor TaxID=2778729 RepID=UPI0019518221|nr:hypothetical protein [Microvirga pudoricolor]MBM6595452.1 hypothetical protein [Microvirga pudoricolor]